MKILGSAVELLMLVIIVSAPIICICRGYGFIKLHLVSVPIIFFTIILAAYWPHFYADLRLDLIGFDFNGMSDAERARDVVPEMREEATRLYSSNMGIGWPLKVIIWMTVLLPYPSIIWLFALVYKKTTSWLSDKNT